MSDEEKSFARLTHLVGLMANPVNSGLKTWDLDENKKKKNQ
jgi:hypothetical protein